MFPEINTKLSPASVPAIPGFVLWKQWNLNSTHLPDITLNISLPAFIIREPRACLLYAAGHLYRPVRCHSDPHSTLPPTVQPGGP
ncbi:hypothetical protein JZ751_008986 [Albula glossodonta]|uniref:Uncharacterized protein n=1 Tax=Albula glossodonta TaxID=121402 RepID=A0A8T2P274_9TELE|nr:hypothetical protein JZ751_008986 [Albula glossodonta]